MLFFENYGFTTVCLKIWFTECFQPCFFFLKVQWKNPSSQKSLVFMTTQIKAVSWRYIFASTELFLLVFSLFSIVLDIYKIKCCKCLVTSVNNWSTYHIILQRNTYRELQGLFFTKTLKRNREDRVENTVHLKITSSVPMEINSTWIIIFHDVNFRNIQREKTLRVVTSVKYFKTKS